MNLWITKKVAAFLICILWINIGICQETDDEETCYALVILKKFTDYEKLSPNYHREGFYLLENGTYDFIINRKKYSFSKIIGISKNSFQLESSSYENGQLSYDTATINLDVDIITIRPSSLHNGVYGLGMTMKPNKYTLKIVKQSKYCRIPDVKVCDDKDCNQFTLGHRYFTQFGWKPIYEEDGKLFLLDMNRKLQIVSNMLK